MAPDQVRAIAAAMIPALLDDLEGDTRNVLLTLARMWATMATGELHSKGNAAVWASSRLPADARGLLDHARTLYENGGWGEWAAVMADARRVAQLMVDEIRLSRR